MATPAYEQLYALQQLDIHLSQLEYRHEHHPLREAIVAADDALATSRETLEEIAGREHDLERSRKRLDDEVATVSRKRGEIKAKLYDGSVTASKDLLAMQEEERHLGERQTQLEDEELEFMEQLEGTASERAVVEATSAPQVKRRAELEQELTVALAETEAETAKVQIERNDTVANVPADMVSRYDQRRKDLGGIAVARVVKSACDGCHLSLSAVAVDSIKKLPDDEVVLCDQCGRMLIH